MTGTAIKVENLSKCFKIYEDPLDRLKEWVSFGKVNRHYDFWALRDVSFEVPKGQCFGIIGPNGAGKSTLLKVLTRALFPTEGIFQLHGDVYSLLELGTGFNLDLTGRQNIYHSSQLLSIPFDHIQQKLPQIIAFADLGDFMDRPIKLYSTGMYIRLAFSLFASLEPDIFLIDEALSVGDIRFSQKCFAHLESQKAKGKTFLFVTHDMQAVLKLCDRVILLDQGRIKMMGYPIEVVDYYYANQSDVDAQTASGEFRQNSAVSSEGASCPASYRKNFERFHGTRYGDRRVEIIGFGTVNEAGSECYSYRTGDSMGIEIWSRAHEDVVDLTMTFQVTDRFGTVVFGQNTYMATKKTMNVRKGKEFLTRIELPCSFFEGEYLVAVGATGCSLEMAEKYYDFFESCLHWVVGKPAWRTFHGIIEMTPKWQVHVPMERLIKLSTG